MGRARRCAPADPPMQLPHCAVRWTGQRRRIIELLAAATRPLAVSDLLRLLPRTAVSTLYRDLTLLEEAGAIQRLLGLGAVAYFEMREPTHRMRHHLVCLQCGPIVDMSAPAKLVDRILSAAAEPARDRGFQLRSYRLDAVGLCGCCRG
jgi:Fur family transcriptional regulator, ferric uptake regulator